MPYTDHFSVGLSGRTGNYVTRLEWSDRDETWWEEQAQALGTSLTEPDRIRALWGELEGVPEFR